MDPKYFKPAAKRQAYVLLAECLHSAHPGPTEENWANFGFCTCRNRYEENNLGGLYAKLLLGDKVYEDIRKYTLNFLVNKKLRAASFKEFWLAYERGSLIQLMDSCGLQRDRQELPWLEAYLSVPPLGPQTSVWSLRQFVEIDDPSTYPPIPAVGVDYGFMNCKTFEETCILMQIYKRLPSKANPLDLHQACLRGHLFEFAGLFHKMDESHRGLMKNFYPLERHEDVDIDTPAATCVIC